MAKPERIAIIGAGLMGHGIAQVFAVAGHPVNVFDVSTDALVSLHARIADNLRSLGLSPDLAQGIEAHAQLPAAVRDADVVIEAGPERLAWKRQLFAELEGLVKPDALLASNTSVIPITQIMSGLHTGHRALGTHWWNPPYLVPLVEVIKTPETGEEQAQQMFELLARAGKTPALVHKDVPGFIGNRMQHALWREAIALVAEGVCDAETVDTVVKASFGRRLPVLGPLENADLVGVELTLAIHETVLPYIDHTPGPSPYLSQLIAEGRLGMKSGQGFRSWTPQAQQALKDKVRAHLVAMNQAESR